MAFEVCDHCGRRALLREIGTDGEPEISCVVCGYAGPTRWPTREKREGVVQVRINEARIPGARRRASRTIIRQSD